MGYRFNCSNCNHTWDVPYMGNYPTSFITDNPCPKCDKKTITAQRLESQVSDNTNKAPIFTYGNPKKPSRDFVNFVQEIKRVHRGSTIEDKW